MQGTLAVPPSLSAPVAARPPAARPTLHSAPLRPLLGDPCEPARELRASFQPFTRGFLLWQHESRQLLLLHASGRLEQGRVGEELPSLGEPLVPAERVLMQLQRCQRGSLLWTPRTGLLLLFATRWQLPFEVME